MSLATFRPEIWPGLPELADLTQWNPGECRQPL
jgi:hypothetical protein